MLWRIPGIWKKRNIDCILMFFGEYMYESVFGKKSLNFRGLITNWKFKKLVILMQYSGPDFDEHISMLAKYSHISSQMHRNIWFHQREKFWRQKNVSTFAIWGNVFDFPYSNHDSFKIWNWHISKNILLTFRN